MESKSKDVPQTLHGIREKPNAKDFEGHLKIYWTMHFKSFLDTVLNDTDVVYQLFHIDVKYLL